MNNYPPSTVSYDTTTNNDGGYLDIPSANSPVADMNYRAEKQYLEDRIATAKGRLELHEDDPDEFDYSDEDETMFVNLALVSHLAVKLRDLVPRGTHVKGSIPYTHAFTGKDIVVRLSLSISIAMCTPFTLGCSQQFSLQFSATLRSHSI